jgi:hypothetical protein
VTRETAGNTVLPPGSGITRSGITRSGGEGMALAPWVGLEMVPPRVDTLLPDHRLAVSGRHKNGRARATKS